MYIKTDSTEKTSKLLAKPDIVKRFELSDGWVSAEMPSKVRDTLANTKGVTIENVNQFEIVAPPWCDPDSTHPACKDDDGGDDSDSTRPTPNDQTPWGIETIYGDDTITATTGGSGIKVAVLDTGIAEHLDFADEGEAKIQQCLDYTGGGVKSSCKDGNGHGTHVSGTIAANAGTDDKGIYGVASEATLLVYKVCNNGGMCSGDAISAAIEQAADDGANIISISLGGSSLSTSEKNALDYATGSGVLVIAAAGNSGPDLDTIKYPAAYYKVVSVAALQDGTQLSVPDFSSRGADATSFEETDRLLEVSAPGRSVESTWKDGEYNTISGTSMATPHISGLAAKMWSSISDSDNDGLLNDDVRDWLQNRADDYDITSGKHAGTGYDPASGLGLPQVP
ncbi:MAG: S8 family serine peptidase [Nitrosopumilaceae archaeon]|nr:S8 family serine peptidase [Nitrosopumilaceae archaeon]NIU00370.1 S8 family serine peptidase [Nitrosopumilaceae archaeon]NIV65472.1 S8 family serine peptidase [Nitrosopumilaceae archaeon]NIX60972.1 S8 family serine peptidase [Nitrosopumilaceae archaeon]